MRWGNSYEKKQKQKTILPAAVQYVPNVRDFYRGWDGPALVHVHHNLLSF